MNKTTKNHKSKQCIFFKKGSCNKDSFCTYAHGKNEIKEYIKKCKFGINCINKEKGCIFDHTNDLDHIKNNNNEITDNFKNTIDKSNIKSKLQNKYKELSKIDKEDWANDFEIKEIEDEIDNLKLEYKKLKNINKKINYYDNLDLDVIFNLDTENNNDNINTIGSINCDNKGKDFFTANCNINVTINELDSCKNNDNNEIIENIEKDIIKYVEEIKNNVYTSENIKKDIKITLMNDINRIKSNITLFKNNYNDIIKYNI